MKKLLALLLSAALALSLTSCGGNSTPAASSTPAESLPAASAAAPAEDEENYDTGDASLDDPLNQDGIGEKELLVVSFGTSYNDSRRLTIGAIEKAVAAACPDYSVRRGFTSQIIIDHVKSRDGEVIDNVGEALDRAVDNGVKTLVVQPTHLMNGFEYNDLVDELAQYADAFERLAVGEPLLTSDGDFQRVMQAVAGATKEYAEGKTAVCRMGHGTEADSNAVYAKMQETFTAAGHQDYFVGTVEATPSLDDVLSAVKAGTYERVVLMPLMIVAGDHANNDMAGEEDSWRAAFEGAGYQVECLVRGLGELEEVQQLLTEHAQAAVREAETVPVTADSLNEGTWPVTVESSSSMFKVVSCDLTVKDGKMSAEMTMSGQGYLYVYMGTGAQAEKASQADYIPFAEDGSGAHTFTVPVEALDKEIDCAAFSKKKEQWYDRTLVFRAGSLPAEALKAGEAVTAQTLGLADGEYTVEVELEGGSGKAGVASPARLTVKGGEAAARIVMSSSNYDLMAVDGTEYEPVSTEGGSTFEIPVPAFDKKVPIQAETTAMSAPHMIDYTLYFNSASVAPAQ